MPVFAGDPAAGFRGPLGVTPQKPGPAPSFGDVAVAATLQSNILVNGIRWMRDKAGLTDDPHYDLSQALPDIKAAGMEGDINDFVGSGSLAEVQATIREKQENERMMRTTAAAAGATGVVAGLFAGLTDPTVLIPGTMFFKAGKAGWTATRMAGGMAAAGAVAAGVQEGALYATTRPDMKLGEVAVNVGTSTLLSALLGSTVGGYIGKVNRLKAEALLQFDRDVWARELLQQSQGGEAHAPTSGGEAPAPDTGGEASAFSGQPLPSVEVPKAGDVAPGEAAPAGAAVTDTRELKPVSPLGVTRIPVIGTLLRNMSPTMRTAYSPFVAARRAFFDLAETALRFVQNERGETTTLGGGPALSRSAKMADAAARVRLSMKLDELFSEYRGRPDATPLQSQRDKIGSMVGRALGTAEGKMTDGEFRTAVADAMDANDTHAIPEVQQAAQWVRRNIFDPWKDRAVAAGMLPEDINDADAASYFMRVYNKDAITANRPKFEGILTDWLDNEQTRKAAAQERINAIVDEMDRHIARLEDDTRPLNELTDSARQLDMLKHKLEEEIRGWGGKSASEAMSAIRTRDRAAAKAGRTEDQPQLQSADRAVASAARRIVNSERGLSRDELRSRAREIVGRILGSPDGRLPYDAPSGGPKVGAPGGESPRGPLAAREFNIPNQLIKDFTERDVERVAHSYLRTMIPDVLLTERFGDVNMTETFKKLQEEHDAMANAAATPAARNKLKKQYDAAVRDLAAVRDRIRNVYSSDPKLRNLGRVSQAVKSWNVLSDLGGVSVSSIPDIAGPIFGNGFTRVLRGAYLPFFKSVKRITGQRSGWAEAKRQYRVMGIVTETYLSGRTNSAYELLESYRPGSKFERGLQAVTDKSVLVTGIAQWTDFGKTVAAAVSGNEIFRAARLAAEGKLTPKLRERLAASGIDEEMAKRIWSQFQNGGETVDGVHLPNTGDWTDIAARDAFEGAIGREADMQIISPGQEKPLWLSGPIGSILGQFKTFGAAATERYLIAGLQRHDIETLSGLTAAVSAGMVAYVAYRVATGQEVSADPGVWVKEGISRSGVLGWFEEGNAFMSKITAGTLDIYRPLTSKPSTRFASRSAMGQLLGPTFGKLENLLTASGDLWGSIRGSPQVHWNASDTHNMRRVFAFQNLVGLRLLFDKVEKGLNGVLRVPEKGQ